MIKESLQDFKHEAFQADLLDWFQTYQRDLPWRRTKDPYYIWISEVMLQQTKVDTVITYYKEFIKRYPRIQDLAEADEQDVLKVWEGLGYYSRARHLHEAAKEVVAHYNGELPQDPTALGSLKGIGPYTQGAILSIAFDQAEPAVDGNVMRVLSRILLLRENIMEAKTRKQIEAIVREIISTSNPSAFNQGLMELGALICTPRSPKCKECPVQSHCRAYKRNEQDLLPIRIRKTKRQIKEYATVCLFDEAGRVAIEQRQDSGLLANMWQFPMFEKESLKKESLVEQFAKQYGARIRIKNKLGRIHHVFSHITWHVTIYDAQLDDTLLAIDNLHFSSLEELTTYPISVAHQKVLEYLK